MAYNPLNPNGQASMASSQPVVIASNQSPVSVLATITGNPSISGQVGASIIGLTPVAVTNIPSISGTVGASIIGLTPVAVTNTPSISGTVNIGNAPSVYGNIAGSVVAFQGGTQITSISGQVTVVSSIAGGIFPISGSVAAVITNNVTVVSSIAGGIFPISGSVAAVITNTNVNVSGSVAAIISGSTNASVIAKLQDSSLIAINAGSVVAISQGSVITVNQGSSILAVPVGSTIALIQGSVAAIVTNIPSISGTVQIGSVVGGPLPVIGLSFSISSVTQAGTWKPSILGNFNEDSASTDGDPGVFVLGVRNDTVASLVGADKDYGAFAQDSAGRQVIKPFAPDESRFSYVGSVVSASVTLIQASVIGKRSYITDFWITNTGATTTLVTFQDGSTSVLGYTIAPSGGGSNAPGIAIPMRTAPSQDLAFKGTTQTSILYLTVNGYQSP